MVDVNIDIMSFLDIAQTLFDNGQRDEPEEVHLNQSDGFDDMAVILGNKHPFLRRLVFHGGQRREIRQVIRTDDDAACVYAYLPDSAFQPSCIFEHVFGVRVAELIFMLQFVNQFVATVQIDLGLLGAL